MHQVFFVDDHPILLDGLRAMIESQDEFEICGTASTTAEALERLQNCQPDLLVTDITLPDRSGLELIKDLRPLYPDLLILVLSMHDEALYAERVIRAGARGYAMKGVGSAKILQAMRNVVGGGIHLSDEASAQILSGLCGEANKPVGFRLDQLTDRELEVFELVGQGKSAPEIGDLLHISPRTVDAHRVNIRQKLGLADSSALLRYAVRWVVGNGACSSADESK